MEAIRAEMALHWPIKEKQAADANTFVFKKDSNAIDRGQAPAEPGTKSGGIHDKEKADGAGRHRRGRPGRLRPDGRKLVDRFEQPRSRLFILGGGRCLLGKRRF